MSSQVKLTLRPPPNVDFVHGYPGIPPGPDRPQAAVKGAIEVRVGPQGAKAKWVRIELRKVETLPGGGVVNTFHDFVGPSPVNLWSASEEYGLLRSQDFPFSIRIPESIPPSIDLQNRAGINYELLASVCTKGKKGFLRKRKSVVVSTQADILIDKHELHSTWPVYCQPETRSIPQEGVTLSVERNATCYGPGDRVALFATVKSDALHTVILRGFELTLKESTIFRAGPYTSGKKSAPQVRVVTISENKFPVNATLYGGTQHRTELACMISPDHTTTTLNAARHIDITYTLSVKALMGTGTPLIMDLPVIVSNWQRAVSAEAIRRIGPAPSLSLLPNNPPRRAEETQPQTFAGRDPVVNRTVAANAYNTMPVSSPANLPPVDEFGGYTNSKPTHRTTNSRSSADEAGGSTARPGGRRPGSADRNRFTITNAPADMIPEDPPAQRAPATAPKGTAPRNKAWPTAEDEKARLYEEARRNVEKTQGLAARGASPPPVRASTPPRAAAAAPANRWPTAEEEKLRLFNEAQEAVKKTQGLEFYSGPSRSGSYQASTHGRSNSDLANDSSSKPVSAAAGGSSRLRNDSGQQASTAPKVPQYMTADQEKAALKRYHEAKQAVGRVQGYVSDEPASGSSPVAYDSLFPSPASPSGSSANAPNSKGDSPPPFEAGSPNMAQLSEKERLRRAYAAQDAAALQNNRPANDAPPPFSGGPQPSAFAEKQMLQKKFEAQDAEARRVAGAPQPPPRKASNSSLSRPTPPSPGAVKVLTALEEKALLKAKFDAEDAPKPKVNGNSHSVYTNGGGLSSPSSSASAPSTPPVPPPLKPRPPVEYIQETQEEDLRVSRFVTAGVVPAEQILPSTLSPSPSLLRKSTSPGLDVSPFTPFTPGFDSKLPGPPPPLPPKPAE